MTAPRISVALDGPGRGYVIAWIRPEGYDKLPPSQWTQSGPTLVVGTVRLMTPDGQADCWRAWLWPKADGDLHVTQSCDAVNALSPELLTERLQRRADKSAWWQQCDEQRRTCLPDPDN